MSSVLRGRRKPKKEEPKKESVAQEIEEGAKKIEKGVKKEAKKLEKAVERKAERKPKAAPTRPTGRIPEAMVSARHGTGLITRPARGFSLGELTGAGMTPRLAIGWGVRVDLRRRSVVDGNVSSLRGWNPRPGTESKVEREAKKVEEEVIEAGEEIEREAVIVAKGAAKVGKEVKREAKKAEEAVKEKVGKPRARPKKKEKS